MTDTTSTERTIASTVSALPASAAERFADHVVARVKSDGEWHEVTYSEALNAIEEVALGLAELGIEVGDRVGLLANTRWEWTVASYGISAAGGVVVPIYPTNSPRECEWVIGNSGARAVFCEDPGQREKIEKVRGNLDALEHVIGFEADAGEMTLEDLRGRGGDRESLTARQDQVDPEDPYTIVYTSGTTGNPKGVVLTHANAMSVCQMVEEIKIVQPGDTTYLYLPLAHCFALTAQLATFDQGTTLVYFGGNTKEIFSELMETKPSYVPSVPRIFEKLYAMAMGQKEKASEEDQRKLEQAIKLGVEVRLRQQRGEEVPEEMREPFEKAEAEVFERVRGLFGGHVRLAISGAAPIAPEILEFFYAAGVPVLEGWGMTETAAVGTVGRLEAFKFGTVGKAMPGVELKTDEDGEILIKGPNIFKEYWKNPEATEETFAEDGWMRTGDIGEIDDEGFLKITGRKKDIIITAGGKNLTPSNIENDLKQSRFISQAVMYADRKPYPVALITLDPDEIVPWAKENGLPEDPAELCEHEKVRELVQKEVDRANEHYAQVEQIKKFTILDHDLSIETGELTPTLKVKRNVINENYREVFESMYS